MRCFDCGGEQTGDHDAACCVATLKAKVARLRFVIVETIKLTAGPLPFALTMEIGDLLGVPELRTTSAQSPAGGKGGSGGE